MAIKDIGVMMAEDQGLLRDSLLILIERDSRIKILGDAGNGAELLELMAARMTDVVLLDLDMPVMNGYDTFIAIKKAHPATRVIFLSEYLNMTHIERLLKEGASACLSKKKMKPEAIIQAIHEVYETGFYSPTFLREEKKSEGTLFTTTQLSVMLAICKGKSSKEIAGTMGRSMNTIETHRKKIFAKAGVNCTAGLIMFCVREGFIASHGTLFLPPPPKNQGLKQIIPVCKKIIHHLVELPHRERCFAGRRVI